jgi:hypothetical protein
MEQSDIQQRIEAYINAYNNFDVAGMLATLHPSIEFKNMANGELTLTTKGIKAFEAQARQATQFFKQRKQTITAITFANQQAEVNIDYQGVLAIDLPNGLKSGDTLTLQGKSIFRFTDNLISYLEDIS